MRAKKYVVIYAVAIFLIIFLITFNSVCAITQFDVRYTVGSEKMTLAAERVQDTLDSRYLNKSFLFFKDSDIRQFSEIPIRAHRLSVAPHVPSHRHIIVGQTQRSHLVNGTERYLVRP